MRPLPILVLLLLLLPGAFAAAQEGSTSIWQRSLEDTGDLVERIEALHGHLETGDAAAVAGQFRAGKVRLFSRVAMIPDDLYAHSQALCLLRDFFEREGTPALRVSLARLNDARDHAVVAFDIQSARSFGIRPVRERIVAVYHLAGDVWEIKELGCH